tara:strand:- start:839 stop:1225 length:387 start_codon:yes stop_codon:yes gene_type:complete
MKNKIMIIVATLTIAGCSSDNKEETTLNETSILVPLDKEPKAKGYNDKYIQIPNTEDIDYALYRRHWNRVNGRLTSENKHNPTKPVELNLDDLSFNHAFNIEYCAKGEGHTFWWRGNEYTTDILAEKQ